MEQVSTLKARLQRHLAAKLAELQATAGMSDSEVSRRTGISRGQVARLNGKDTSRPGGWKADHLEAIADAFGLHPRDLMPPRDEPSAPPPEVRPPVVDHAATAAMRDDFRQVLRQALREGADQQADRLAEVLDRLVDTVRGAGE